MLPFLEFDNRGGTSFVHPHAHPFVEKSVLKTTKPSSRDGNSYEVLSRKEWGNPRNNCSISRNLIACSPFNVIKQPVT